VGGGEEGAVGGRGVEGGMGGGGRKMGGVLRRGAGWKLGSEEVGGIEDVRGGGGVGGKVEEGEGVSGMGLGCWKGVCNNWWGKGGREWAGGVKGGEDQGERDGWG